MTMLRNRLLIASMLATFAVSAIGVGTVSARPRPRMRGEAAPSVTTSWTSTSSSSVTRGPAGMYSGEPDAGSGTKPSTTHTNACPSGTTSAWEAVSLWARTWGWLLAKQ